MGKNLRIGLAGLGTVGSGVLDMLKKNHASLNMRTGHHFTVTAISVRDKTKPRTHNLKDYKLYESALDLSTAPDIDILVELIGGEGAFTKQVVEAALRAGKHVVTANKALLAHHGTELALLAEQQGVCLNFEAAVAGGIPAIKTLREGLAGNEVSKVFGILNGTCNYILTKMGEEGRKYADVLSEAQSLGYAEADPSFDVGGFDTAHKLAILTSLAFGTEIALNDIQIEGIEHITLEDIRNADELGYKIKLLGVAQNSAQGVEQRVHPTLVPKGSTVSETDGVFNAVVMRGDFVGDVFLEGRGAGSHPTASAVVADLVDIAMGNKRPVFGIPATKLKAYKPAPTLSHAGGFYVALNLMDKPGAVAAIARKLADQKVSIESIVQHGRSEQSTARETASFILITYDTVEAALRQAIAEIARDGFVAGSPRVIRIERL